MGQSTATPDPVTRSERIGVAVTPDEMNELRKLVALYPEKWEGVASVLRDLSVEEALRLVRDREQRLRNIGA